MESPVLSSAATTKIATPTSTSTSTSTTTTTTPDRKLPFRSYWFICDLDGTLVPSPMRKEGAHLPLTRSPCNSPVAAWLRGGGNLAVISTAGTNLFRQILQPLSKTEKADDFRGSLILCGFSGAAMFRLKTRKWEKVKELDAVGGFHMEEVTEYRYCGGPNGTTTCVSNAVCHDVFGAAVELYRKMFALFQEDESRVDLLSRRYRVPFKKLVEIRKQYSKEGKLKEFNEEYMSGKVLTRQCEKVDRVPLICFQSVPRAERHSSSSYTFEEHQQDEDFVIAQISFLGVPAKLFPLLFLSPSSTNVLEQPSTRAKFSSLAAFFKEKLDLKVVCQPNSVAIVKCGVDKGSAIQWMLTHPEGFANISPLRCIAVGDQPQTVDATMMRFSSKFTLPFFSVGKPFAKNQKELEASPREVQLAVANGGLIEFGEMVNTFEEYGTALLFVYAMDYLENASSIIQENLLKFTRSAQNATESPASISRTVRMMMRENSDAAGGGNGDGSEEQGKRQEQHSITTRTATSTSAQARSASTARSLTETLAASGQLRMPTVEAILADLHMNGDRTSMGRRALQLIARYDSHL